MDYSDFRQRVLEQIKDIYKDDPAHSEPAGPDTSTAILCPSCHKPKVKPTTVLYGRNLPAQFFDQQDLLGESQGVSETFTLKRLAHLLFL